MNRWGQSLREKPVFLTVKGPSYFGVTLGHPGKTDKYRRSVSFFGTPYFNLYAVFWWRNQLTGGIWGFLRKSHLFGPG